MERNEAVCYLKEILGKNNQISPNIISLDRIKACKGYSIRIKEVHDTTVVIEVAKKHNLEIIEDKGELILYKSSSEVVTESL